MTPSNDIIELETESFIRKHMHAGKQSTLRKYQTLVTGKPSLLSLARYELVTSLFGACPGALGLALRKITYHSLFKSAGKGLVIGRNVTIRHGDNIILGRNVIIDDNCVIDARGAGEHGIVIEDDTIIGRDTIIQSKAGPIRIGQGSNIGSHSLICAMGGVDVGENALIAGGCKISGGMYHAKRTDVPIIKQGVYTAGPVVIKPDVWFGMGAMVLDNVTVGRGAILGSGAVATRDIPDFAVAVGIPAKVIRIRNQTADPVSAADE